MATLPSRIEQRDELDCRLGIKSSLNGLSSVVAFSYILYCANGRKSEIIYADEETTPDGKRRLVLKEHCKHWILDNYFVDENVLNNNPLLTSQLEALQVGLGLMFHLAKISYVDFPNTDTKERTGGERFRKMMKFALNMKYLDLYLSAYPRDIMKAEILSWLNNSPSDSVISNGLKQLLTAFSEETQFKIRAQGQEVVFQQVGIYGNISEEEGVIAKDEQEDVGPFRIFKSFVREGLHPFLSLEKNEFVSNAGIALEDYKEMVETTLSLSPRKTVLYQEVAVESEPESSPLNESRQIIYYGAPGTGKSHKIKEHLENGKVPKENIFRTTFHPDSDYSTFVGAYKPTRGRKPLYGLNGDITVRLKDGEDLSEEIITYKFVPQAFLNAYMQAYKKPEENVYLIIEEINRGNCAQIFGDLFQLLDRKENGVSEYTVKADADLRAFLEEELGTNSDAIKGGELCLPPNLYIYATMNTSDQSLFPIDSAFKRRWDWEYEPIKYKNTSWMIDIKENKYSWVSFQKEINKRIFEATNSEDKMLGDYFVNPGNGKITSKLLLNKILFYLWNDVCKDGEGEIFKTSDTEDVSFSELHGDEGIQKLIAMMEYLGVEKYDYNFADDETKNAVDSEIMMLVNNQQAKYYNAVPYMVIGEYIKLNPNKTAQEVIDFWKPYKQFSYQKWIICDREEHDRMNPKYADYSVSFECADGEKIWVNKDGWTHHPAKPGIRDTIQEFMDAVNAASIGILITEKEVK